MQREERKEADTGPKEVPAGKGLVPENWLIVKDTPVELVVVSRAALLKRTGEDKNFQEGATMKAMEKKATQCRKNWKESGTKCEFASGCFSLGEPEL